ncbi:MAG: hypothetical protein RR817_10935 [Niameybacter sp.]
MKFKTITVGEFIKNGLEDDVVCSITKDKPLRWRLDDWLRDKGLDSYSLYERKQFRRGVTNDLHYDGTLAKCDDEQYIRFLQVDGYSDLMEFKHEKELNKDIARKVKKLIQENRVGYMNGDSYGCQLACRKEDYISLCNYLGVEYDARDDDKEFYYNSLFDDIRIGFDELCDEIYDIKEHMNERQMERFEKTIYNVSRYVIAHIDKYKDIILSAKEWNKDTKDDFWINKLWNQAYSDMKTLKLGCR